MLKPPEFNTERRGSGFLPDPNFMDNSRRRNSNYNLNAHIASLEHAHHTKDIELELKRQDEHQAGVRRSISMDPSDTGLENGRSSIMDGILNIGSLLKPKRGQVNSQSKSR